ncbi:autotransporter domain-containing protein [Leptotrichia sp. oral taxon 847]|uniref:autotransporter domain-containing protein n=1 Tax=Leptotrichia sp. oral taxon 847 TaxID=1785996 RepID=UPI000767E7CA|nr:spherulation-specific family 4 protein [Leptotrichia sp. oral taxon 847]AMD94850.1 autotransporter protein [Leptotrichia sp. oral taxon 847]
MKKQLKRIIPCFVAGIAGISYGNTNSIDDTDNLVKISENKNEIAENLDMRNSSKELISDDSISERYNFKRNTNFNSKKENYNDPDKIQINLEFKEGFSKKHKDFDNKTIKSQQVVMPAFRWTGKSGVNASFWKGITDVGGGLIPYVAFGSYKAAPSGDPHQQYLVKRDEDMEQIARNKAAGIKNIGYTYTHGSTRNLDLVYGDIDNFVNFYGRENIAGYFIDEIEGGATQAQIDYMAKIYNYIKSKYPEMTVIANNGWGIRDGIAPYADIWMTQEVSATEYLNNYRARTSEFEKDPANSNHILHVIYNATPEQYEEIIKLSRERNAGNLFITSDTNAYPNGYDDLPTYFEDLMMTINNFTPKTGTLFSPENQAAEKVTVEMPRSKVDLDLTRSARNTTLKNLEKTKDGQYKLDIQYLGNNGGKYSDKESNVKYNSDSDGILLNGSKDFGKFTLGTTFGYDTSNVYYKEKFEDVKEKIKSYQLGLNGKYDFNDNIDLMGSLIYSANKHKFETSKTLGAISDAEFKSKILDFSTKLGYKFLFGNGYIKPYVGLGLTKVKEGDIDKLNFSGTSTTSPNGTVGIYGETSLGKVDLFGNVEYEHRFSKKSYHREREHLTRYELAPLTYSRGVVNAEAGLKYNIADNFGVKLSYELQDSKNSAVKLGFNAAF